MVTSSSGRFSFWIELSDSPNLPRMAAAAVPHRVQHVLFIFNLDLLPRERRTVLAGDRLERDDVVFSEARNRAVYGGRSCLADADFARRLIGDAGSRRKSHQAKNFRLIPGIVVHNFQKRRLFELDRQALAKCAVEDGVARVVSEIGEDDRVFVGKPWGAMEVEIHPAP